MSDNAEFKIFRFSAACSNNKGEEGFAGAMQANIQCL